MSSSDHVTEIAGAGIGEECNGGMVSEVVAGVGAAAWPAAAIDRFQKVFSSKNAWRQIAQEAVTCMQECAITREFRRPDTERLTQEELEATARRIAEADAWFPAGDGPDDGSDGELNYALAFNGMPLTERCPVTLAALSSLGRLHLAAFSRVPARTRTLISQTRAGLAHGALAVRLPLHVQAAGLVDVPTTTSLAAAAAHHQQEEEEEEEEEEEPQQHVTQSSDGGGNGDNSSNVAAAAAAAADTITVDNCSAMDADQPTYATRFIVADDELPEVPGVGVCFDATFKHQVVNNSDSPVLALCFSFAVRGSDMDALARAPQPITVVTATKAAAAAAVAENSEEPEEEIYVYPDVPGHHKGVLRDDGTLG